MRLSRAAPIGEACAPPDCTSASGSTSTGTGTEDEGIDAGSTAAVSASAASASALVTSAASVRALLPSASAEASPSRLARVAECVDTKSRISERSRRLGTRATLLIGWFVSGLLQATSDMYFVIASRSYVFPSAATTGSSITDCVMGHRKRGGAASSIESVRTSGGGRVAPGSVGRTGGLPPVATLRTWRSSTPALGVARSVPVRMARRSATERR
mmetsp:Transcript_7571/g.23044  ORF Transcript_7571/g.23044 Transcript_7571/m.23044 type:complete len:215 (-) Transcript_7571:803-1447(-)